MIEVKLHQTCSACPEQYNMYIEDETDPIGYFRIRHGYLMVEYLGRVVFESDIRGDGGFDSEERDFFLKAGIQAVLEAHTGDVKDFSYEIL